MGGLWFETSPTKRADEILSQKTNWMWWYTSIHSYASCIAGRITIWGQPWQKTWQDPISKKELGVVVHCYNPSYAGSRDGRIMVWCQFWQKRWWDLIKTSWGWWHTFVIPAMWEAQMRGSQSETVSRWKCKNLSENKLKQKGLGVWPKW
jgi:hypothetical protein